MFDPDKCESNPEKCPKCGHLLGRDPKSGIEFCLNEDCSYVRCLCGRRMIPEGKYISSKETWNFWKCPHDFRRW